MKLSDDELEAAAVAAERWPEGVRCFIFWDTNATISTMLDTFPVVVRRRYAAQCGCPALAASAVRAWFFVTEWSGHEYFVALNRVFSGFATAIDSGRKHEVAAAFRAAKARNEVRT